MLEKTINPLRKIDSVAASLGISKSLIRLWEEEFGLEKRADELLQPVRVAEIKLIQSLVEEKGLTLPDAKAEFETAVPRLRATFSTIEKLQNIKTGLLKIREILVEQAG